MPEAPPPDRRLEHLLPLVVGAAALGLLLLGGWETARPQQALGLGPRTGARLMLAGIVLLVGAISMYRPRPAPGPLDRLAARLPPGTLFVTGAWLAYAVAIKLLAFLSLLWVPHPDRGALATVARLWIEPLCRDWDAGWYQSVAFSGYAIESSNSNVAFFPLYPLLVRAAALLVRDPCWASWLVSQLALLGGLAGVFALTRARLRDDQAARWTVVLLLAWPFAFFLAASYSESLLLCLAAWAFHAAERRRFLLAGLLGALAAATRLTGVALLPALLLVPAWSVTDAKDRGRAVLAELRARWPLWLVPGGTLAFFTYLQIRFGDFWANLHAARAGWGRGPAKGGHDFFAAVGGLFLTAQRPFLLVYTAQLVLALALLPLCRRLPGRHGWGYTLFVLGLALPGVLSGLEAFGRYVAVAFPLAWAAGPTAERHPARMALVLVLLALFQSLFLFLHVHGYWVT